MLVKCLKLSEATNHFRDCSFKAGTRNLIPKLERLDDEQLSEHEVILEMVEKLKEFEMVSKWLQTGDSPNPEKKVTLYSVRKAFDRFCSKCPFVRRRLSATAPIIHEPLFESAVAKLQGSDFNLTPGEKKKASRFLVCDSEAGSDEDEDHANMSFLDEALDDAAAESCKRQKKARPYRSMDHAPATSNVVERLFSRCGIIMRPHRRLMDPSTLEMLIGTHVRLTRL